MTARGWKKIGIVGALVAVVAVFFALGLDRYLTLEAVKASRQELLGLFEKSPMTVVAGYVAVYLVVVGLNLPGALVLGLLAGALFGSLAGTVIVSFASSIGATLACLLSRYLLRDWVRRKLGSLTERVDRGVRAEGAFYLFSLRLIPIIPFFAINLAMGLTAMPLTTFYWVSQLGMLPGTFVFVNAGSQLARLDSLSGILSPGLIISFVLIGLLPLAAKKLLAVLRKRRGDEAGAPAVDSPLDAARAFGQAPDAELAATAAAVAAGCTECGACVQACAFLTAYGTPKKIATALTGADGSTPADPYACSLCRLCTAVCPEKIDPAAMFLAMRRQAVAREAVDLSRYKTILGYEARGHSALFAWQGLPSGCDTIFFPGCTLPGTRPEVVRRMYGHLQGQIPNLGLVLDCCHKPSHDLGRQAHFEAAFGPLRDRLAAAGVKRVLTACPNCHKIFNQYGGPLEAVTIWEHMAEHGGPAVTPAAASAVIHDPCPMRAETAVQTAARTLIAAAGVTLEKTKSEGKRTLCCGEGGSVGFVNPTLAKAWGARRVELADGRSVVTYCAGCAGFLSRAGAKVVHLGNLIFEPQTAMAGKSPVAKAPFTYVNRLRLKSWFKRSFAA